jgi:glycosyltransferase involved in cell wall biosynthesis
MGLKGDGSRPRVVVLLPAWQSAEFIEPTLASLANQSLSGLEILISVDRSNDDTADICRRFAEYRANVRLVVQERRLGWIDNVNWLLANADGDYFLIASDDDLLAPDYVEKLLGALETDEKAVLAFSDVEALEEDGRTSILRFLALEGRRTAFERASQIVRRPSSWYIPYHGLFRAGGKRVPGLERHRMGEFAADWPWVLNMALIGHFVRVPEVLYRKRRRPTSLSFGWSYSQRNWLATATGCARVIRRSRLGRVAQGRLLALLFALQFRNLIAAMLPPVLRAALRPVAGSLGVRARHPGAG